MVDGSRVRVRHEKNENTSETDMGLDNSHIRISFLPKRPLKSLETERPMVIRRRCRGGGRWVVVVVREIDSATDPFGLVWGPCIYAPPFGAHDSPGDSTRHCNVVTLTTIFDIYCSNIYSTLLCSNLLTWSSGIWAAVVDSIGPCTASGHYLATPTVFWRQYHSVSSPEHLVE